MKILPLCSVASLIATFFLVLSTFSFGMPPMIDDPNGRGREDRNQQQQLDQGTRARAATDPDDGGSAKSDEELRGSGSPAIGENDSAEQSKQYRSREDFAAYLAADVGEFSQQLKTSPEKSYYSLAEVSDFSSPGNRSSDLSSDSEKDRAFLLRRRQYSAKAEQMSKQGTSRKDGKEKQVTIVDDGSDDEDSKMNCLEKQMAAMEQAKLQRRVFNRKLFEVASRLSSECFSEKTGSDERVPTPSIQALKEQRFSGFNSERGEYDLGTSWPTKEMSQLEADQEYYEAFKQKEEEALQFLAQDQASEALYCHGIAIMLDRLSQRVGCSQESDDNDDDEPRVVEVYQESIAYSLLLKSPEEINAMTGDEKNAELLLFDAVTAIQEKLQNKEDASELVSLVQGYRSGDLQHYPRKFSFFCKQVLKS
ncbi:MAG: hypothetical protein NT164_02765 [Verrucomicrobiae bacterium]|nr:hypothetical protein [Verrucomicrobiae bacterium]